MKEKLENLIPISIREKGDPWVSARDLHGFLGIKTNFRLWYPKIIDYGFLEDEDYTKVYERNSSLGGEDTVVDYMITLSMAKEISIIHHSKRGKEARAYFINLEKKFKQIERALKSLDEGRANSGDADKYIYENISAPTEVIRKPASKNPVDPTEVINKPMYINTVDPTEVINKSLYKNADDYIETINKPTYKNATNRTNTINKSTYENTTDYTGQSREFVYENTTENTNTLKSNFRDTSKLFGIRENLFVNWLLLNNYCYRDKQGNIRPYAKAMDYFYMKEFTVESGYSGIQTMINAKGREFFRRILTEENII